MKVVGGKEIPGNRGRLGAYIAKIKPGGVVASLGELHEGDLVLEWNGVKLTDKTYEEVQRVMSQSAEDIEVEIVVKKYVIEIGCVTEMFFYLFLISHNISLVFR